MLLNFVHRAYLNVLECISDYLSIFEHMFAVPYTPIVLDHDISYRIMMVRRCAEH